MSQTIKARTSCSTMAAGSGYFFPRTTSRRACGVKNSEGHIAHGSGYFLPSYHQSVSMSGADGGT